MLYTEILNDNRDFVAIYKKALFSACKYSVIYIRPNGKPFNRLGITASKKIGNAVRRNRAKRLIRLAYYNSEINMPVGIDIVIVARSPICDIKSQVYSTYMEKYGVPEIIRLYQKSSGGKKK